MKSSDDLNNFLTLLEIDIFSELDDHSLMLLAEKSYQATFEAQQCIIKPYETVNYLYICIQGQFVDQQGKVLDTIFGVSALLFDQENNTGLYTGTQPVQCLLLAKRYFYSLINAFPAILLYFLPKHEIS